ncbi:CLUMA_CG001806, isoform A [Clunio marinus]|uniref:CLUMA_CG001806, isoform A n=1 Tax=Clunio marinus TaxID=568069 RepID=A0A1J1HKT4_9DIPT|nr:CLUMA_CG001806, isoform A [Clunio marinus]
MKSCKHLQKDRQMKLFVLIFFVTKFAENADHFFFVPYKRPVRKFYPLKWENCPVKTPAKAFLKVPSLVVNTLNISGLIIVDEEIVGDLSFSVEANKCSLNMTACEKYPIVSLRNFCQRFNEKDKVYSAIFDNIQPRIQCPIKPGNYTISPATLDLSIFNLVPLDGFVWVTTFKFISISENEEEFNGSNDMKTNKLKDFN